MTFQKKNNNMIIQCKNFSCFHNQYGDCRKTEIELNDDGVCVHGHNEYSERTLLKKIEHLETELNDANDNIQELEDEIHFS